MKTENIGQLYQLWQPEQDPTRLAVLGKAIEESSELIKELARCIIQGFEASHPETGEPNRCALADELDDMEALIHLIREKFQIEPCSERQFKKIQMQRRWYADISKMNQP